jgi:predicted CXXCH cytochrome family protein
VPRAVLMMLLFIPYLPALAGVQSARDATRAPARQEHPPLGDARQCATCHGDVTARPVMHGPASAGACGTCHVEAVANGRRRLTLARGARPGNTKQLCVSCHAESIGQVTSAHMHAPVAAGDCTSCHDPHGSPFRYFLPAERNGVCLKCHADVAEALGQSVQHGPAVQSCTLCHDPHAARFPFQLRASVNTVCLACHLEPASDDVPADHPALFGRAAADARPLMTPAQKIRLDATRRAGHPNVRHPVEGPVDPNAKGRSLTCSSCHNPHGTAGDKLLRFGSTGVSALRIRCHQF